ncbi:MAG: RNA polymerase sigma factor SigJ [Hyphomonas sp. 34-62-18]|nr:sigma-70 family RNA polymerase sigma factor [Hyphomonas sp. 34-62-18]OZB18232.1 MAG: RNA polymerase sigma factor SigJ [Hyphomonas sp. 34-62-18]
MPAHEPDAQVFEAQRPRLLRLAYRMLGSFAEAEDVVQDAWLRMQRSDDLIEVPAAWLTRVTTRLCLDRLRSARAQRETYIGPWLPEPIIEEEPGIDTDELTFALMMALERLSPLERAAFLLHDVFGVTLAEIAETLGRDAAAVRQLAARARKHVEAGRTRYPVDRAEADRIARAFFAASTTGDIGALRAMLAEDVVLHSDGGGRVIAFRNPIQGLQRVLRLFAGVSRKNRYSAKLIRSLTIDGLPGYISRDRGDVLQATKLDIADGKVRAIYIMRNPEKLGHVVGALGISGEA